MTPVMRWNVEEIAAREFVEFHLHDERDCYTLGHALAPPGASGCAPAHFLAVALDVVSQCTSRFSSTMRVAALQGLVLGLGPYDRVVGSPADWALLRDRVVALGGRWSECGAAAAALVHAIDRVDDVGFR